jgi:hypothetical protein
MHLITERQQHHGGDEDDRQPAERPRPALRRSGPRALRGIDLHRDRPTAVSNNTMLEMMKGNRASTSRSTAPRKGATAPATP